MLPRPFGMHIFISSYYVCFLLSACARSILRGFKADLMSSLVECRQPSMHLLKRFKGGV